MKTARVFSESREISGRCISIVFCMYGASSTNCWGLWVTTRDGEGSILGRLGQ